MYYSEADNINGAISEAVTLLEDMQENELISGYYGDTIGEVINNLESANDDVDSLDTIAREAEEEGEDASARDAISEATSDLERIADDIRTVIRDLEYA